MLFKDIECERFDSNILLWKNVLSKDDCELIINTIETYPEWKEGSIGDNNIDPSYRLNKIDYLTTRYGFNSQLYWSHNTIGYAIKKALEETVKDYRYESENNHTLDALHSCISADEGFQVLKYEKGHFYKLHIDFGDNSKRVISILVYLNDNYKGGETYFPRQNVKVKGNQGDVLVFPSNYCYPHSAEEILEGVKYSVVTWFK